MSGTKREVKKLSKKHRSKSVGLEVFKVNQIGINKGNKKVSIDISFWKIFKKKIVRLLYSKIYKV